MQVPRDDKVPSSFIEADLATADVRGPHGSRPSRREYERIVGEWLQNGRSLPADPHSITVAELINAYRKHAVAYYVKNGESTGTAEGMRPVMSFLRRRYGDAPVRDFNMSRRSMNVAYKNNLPS